jgi:predicted transcriptional regulator
MNTSTNTLLTPIHLEVLLDLRNRNLTYHLTSATKQKAINALQAKKFVEDFSVDQDRSAVRITEKGLQLIDSLLELANLQG